MIWTNLALVVLGIALGVLLRRRGVPTWPALLGVLLAVFATLTGFSIGVFVTPIAAIVLLAAAANALRPTAPPT
jgi:hypothetical protein